MLMRFLNVEPLRDSARVFLRLSAVLTGEEGSIHPSPVPRDPGVENTFREVAARAEDPTDGVKAEASWARRKPLRAREGS